MLSEPLKKESVRNKRTLLIVITNLPFDGFKKLTIFAFYERLSAINLMIIPFTGEQDINFLFLPERIFQRTPNFEK